jgi:hypothetical protein
MLQYCLGLRRDRQRGFRTRRRTVEYVDIFLGALAEGFTGVQPFGCQNRAAERVIPERCFAQVGRRYTALSYGLGSDLS